MYEDGSKNPVYTAGDRSIEPTGRPDGSFQLSGRFFKPREILDVGRPGAGFSKMDRNGKALSVTGAEVEVDFVINTTGTVWGDSKSRVLKDMLEQRRRKRRLRLRESHSLSERL
jgi:hypothetical protein